MSLTQIIAGSWRVEVATVSFAPAFSGQTPDEIKAHFVARGTSLNRFAQSMGVSHALVSKLIHRQRPGLSGRSRKVMKALAATLGERRAEG